MLQVRASANSLVVSFANPVVEVRPLAVTVSLATEKALNCNTTVSHGDGYTELHFSLPEGPYAAASAVFECTS